MKFYSTNSPNNFVSLKEAVLKGLPHDNGLYMPESIFKLDSNFISNLASYSFQDIAFQVSQNLIGDNISKNDLSIIINQAINFPAPLVLLDDQRYVLELFHGPSLAFKDFGARFMAQLMSYFNKDENRELVILVATSGDTGGAVASGFLNTPGVKVVILYPSGKVSRLQEKQLTTLGNNITAIEVNGSFDDCQKLVKTAFLEKTLNNKIRLSSANSINIARLIPQSFYYFEAYKQLETTRNVCFSIPSGNFGNLTAGLFAKKMGLPIHQFLAATNINDIVPQYLKTGIYNPKPSLTTISNAMDVGNPSNFVRIKDLYCSTWNNIKKEIKGFSFSDEETRVGIKEVYKKHNYIIDPHGAIGYLALDKYLKKNTDHVGVILETAHPSKFNKEVESLLKINIPIPKRLLELADKKKKATFLENDFNLFKAYLLENY